MPSSAAAPRRGQFSRCIFCSHPCLPPSSAAELPAACRQALQRTSAAAGLVLQRGQKETPRPSLCKPLGAATETGAARGPGSHAQRGFRGLPQRVKSRERPQRHPKNRGRGRPCNRQEGTPDQHLQATGSPQKKHLAQRHRAIEKGPPTLSECVTRDPKLTKSGGLGGFSSRQLWRANARPPRPP